MNCAFFRDWQITGSRVVAPLGAFHGQKRPLGAWKEGLQISVHGLILRSLSQNAPDQRESSHASRQCEACRYAKNAEQKKSSETGGLHVTDGKCQRD